ncbi:dinuclear metal center YbgI/SA1388 family protein [Enterococcus sp. PF1-24]|uniref:Nif3-like dinuclear metal center hexameric protein n=1 Tax=unclassified Enterococcus TaxID=2608891 RepID=UPI002475F3C4|nr:MULTISPECIES: Nif3-like dinuclear metal center hexameric protein [unclassified Enterococcus]MDH6365222.1 dinuclear metal center YbgI/SA1388 family protein [Enterococcus sp. PFB1-1]MDH6402323.1 dinuclear metal center YbgI/SA1388 family protein [Enterococcus sp. PF1-24]
MVMAKEFIEVFEDYCPQWLSETGDVSGLQVGSLQKKLTKVMVTLDIRPQVVEEAIAEKVDLIITKHAPIFRPVAHLTDENLQSAMLLSLIKHDIAVYVAHTNMDIVNDGLNDWFCEVLTIEVDDFLHETHQVANQTYGIGRIGDLAEAMPINAFIEKVKTAFQVADLRVVFPTEPKDLVQRIAICGGSGEKFYHDALQKKADVYITGDVYYHTAHDMQSAGLTVIDPGHYIESLCKAKLVDKFNQWRAENHWDIEFIASKVNTNPFTFC